MTNHTTTKCRRPKCPNLATSKGGYCRKHAHAAGTAHHRRPVADAQHLINTILNQGATFGNISQHTGISHSSLNDITTGRYRTVRVATINKLRDCLNQPLEKGWHPAWPLTRRIRALRAIGYSIVEIAQHSGVSESTLTVISNERATHATGPTNTAVRNTYDQLQHTPYRTPHHTARNWTPPAGWDNIDDPQEQPTTDNTPHHHHAPVEPVHRAAARYIINSHGSPHAASRAMKCSSRPLAPIADGTQPTARHDFLMRLLAHAADLQVGAVRTAA
jgi:DNA-binding Xre family transcriptional regulator